jgi:hypothetical protein
MSKQFQFSYQCPPIGMLPPAADAAGRTGPYKSLRNASGKVAVVCRVNQGNAAQVTFSLLQATSSGGAGSKAVGTTASPPIFFNINTTLSDTLVAQTAANSFQTDVGLTDKIVVFEFDPADALDLANGFNHLAVQTSASNVANITEAYMEYLGRYQQQVPPASEV